MSKRNPFVEMAMWLHLNCISAGFQTSEKTTVLGGGGRRGKPSVLPFLLFPIH